MAFSHYTRPGPGVSKSGGYELNRFAGYFQLLGRKLWSLCLLSLLVTLFTLPYLAAAYGLLRLFRIASVFARIGGSVHLALVLAGLPFAFYGPVVAAAVKIARDFVREEPVFLFSDFLAGLKSSPGKTIAISALTYFFVAALTFALPAYFFTPGVGVYLFFPLTLIAALALLFMQFYAYPMAVACKLSLRDLLKNALIFAFFRIFTNLLQLLLLALAAGVALALVILAFSYPLFYGFFFLYLFFVLPGFSAFSVCYLTYPPLQQYVIEPYYRDHPQQTAAAVRRPLGEDEQDSEDEQEKQEQKPLPEYVYHNGRMVHRSVIESQSLFADEPGAPKPNDPPKGGKE